MRIYVGSLNPAKVEAVRETLADYHDFASHQVFGFEAVSGVSEQPKTLEETVLGAINRAKHAAEQGDLGFGLESGLMDVPYAKTGKMDVCVCAIWDGQEAILGISSAWECPADVTRMMLEDGLTMNDAFYKSGRTDDPKIGNTAGAIGLLTRGRVDRKAYTVQAIQMAMIHLEKEKMPAA